MEPRQSGPPSGTDALAAARAALEAALVEAAGIDLSWIDPPPASTGWTLAPDALRLLASLVAHVRPRHVLEFGSGLSTRVLARACAELRPPCYVTSVDHDPKFGRIAQRHVAADEVDCRVRCQIAPLVAREYAGKIHPVYYLRPGGFASRRPADLVLIDGPAGMLGGREGTLYQALSFTRPGTIVLLDDASRAEESAALCNWQRTLGDAIEVRLLPDFARGLAGIVVREPHVQTRRSGAPA